MAKKKQEDLLKTLGDFTSKENWDSFFTIRGSGDAFEWYAEWPELKDPLLSHLSAVASPSPAKTQILVPGCGNSRLSENLYDEGYKNITNVDFSKIVISDMLRRNVRTRPEMKWRVMDMTNLQLENESFDAIIDKGGLDALMEPELGPKLGSQYLSEVKRVLKAGGKFICLTLAESHVLALLLPKFRYGWKVSVNAIPKKPSGRASLETFMVIAEKDNSALLCPISSLINQTYVDRGGAQAQGLSSALESENAIRSKLSGESDIVYLFEDLKTGAKGNLEDLDPGRRVQLILGEPGVSRFVYKAVLLDAKQDHGPFVYNCGAFLVPKSRANEWLFSSEEGQWTIVESSKAARLVMILLDSSHINASMDDIQTDLSPMVKQLAPGGCDGEFPFLAASDGIKQRKIIHQVTSALTGPIIVDDVVYEKVDDDISNLFPAEDIVFRRLTFERSEGLVQSETVLTREVTGRIIGEKEQKKASSSSKSRKKGNQRKSASHASIPNGSDNGLNVDHNYLASPYHTGIISGFILISQYLGKVAARGETIKASVIGLGAGLLPMFLHRCLPFLEIEVLELDPVVLDLARDYFNFSEDKHLKVHITDGIEYVEKMANFDSGGVPVGHPSEDAILDHTLSREEEKVPSKIDILVVDVDSSDSSSGLSCPAANFVEESFLLAAKNSLTEKGLFVINLVTRSQAIKDMVFSRMKAVFSNLFLLQLEEDLNEVIFAIKEEACINENDFPKACQELARLLKLEKSSLSEKIINSANKIKRLT